MSVEDQRKRSNSEIILPKECLALPSICQEGLRSVSNRLRMMKENNCWFRARNPDELNPILAQVQGHVQGIFDDLRKYKKGGSWDAVWYGLFHKSLAMSQNEALHGIWDAARDTARVTAWSAAEDMGWKTARFACISYFGSAAEDVNRDAVWMGASVTAWETIKDLPGFEKNPYAHYLSLYELGAAGIRFGEVTDGDTGNKPEEMLIVHFPLKLKYDRGLLALACLAFPDGQLGDQEVKYIHDLSDQCSQITLLNPPPQRRIR